MKLLETLRVMFSLRSSATLSHLAMNSSSSIRDIDDDYLENGSRGLRRPPKRPGSGIDAG